MNFEDLLKQYTIASETDSDIELELDDELHYNDYYQHQGIAHIKKRGKIILNDPLIDLALELDVERILTPLEEYKIRNDDDSDIDSEYDTDDEEEERKCDDHFADLVIMYKKKHFIN
jgi:hypothetical protein